MKEKIIISVLLIVLVVASRLLPHMPNFVPVGAVVLLVGAYFKGRIFLVVPLMALFISDWMIGFYDWRLMAVVYASYLTIGWFAKYLLRRVNFESVVIAGVLASILFFIFTNFAVWLFSNWYVKDIQGLLYCYELALPFFRYTLFGNIFYGLTLFGVFGFVSVFKRSVADFGSVNLKNQL